MLIDLHTHRSAPYPEGIVSVEGADFSPVPGQAYSVGVHPWYLKGTPEEVQRQCDVLEAAARHPQVVAIGEAGFDTVRGGAMMLQTLAFRRQVDLSESLRKPLVIHCVKTLDMILAWHKETRPTQPWIVHGFRGKPKAAEQILDAGMMLSFGERFNPETLAVVPAEAYFAETDESPLPITEIIAAHSVVRGFDMLPLAAANMKELFNLNLS